MSLVSSVLSRDWTHFDDTAQRGWGAGAATRTRFLFKKQVIEKEKREEKISKNHWHWAGHADNSRLVEVFLWEKRYDEAWQEASAGGCSSGLWLRVAAAREEKHPGDAVPIYKEMIAPTLKQANNAAYAEAAKLLGKIRELMARLGRETEFEDYLAALRVEYKGKRNFIKLLDKIESS